VCQIFARPVRRQRDRRLDFRAVHQTSLRPKAPLAVPASGRAGMTARPSEMTGRHDGVAQRL
jgi:hypothetical protein